MQVDWTAGPIAMKSDYKNPSSSHAEVWDKDIVNLICAAIFVSRNARFLVAVSSEMREVDDLDMEAYDDREVHCERLRCDSHHRHPVLHCCHHAKSVVYAIKAMFLSSLIIR